MTLFTKIFPSLIIALIVLLNDVSACKATHSDPCLIQETIDNVPGLTAFRDFSQLTPLASESQEDLWVSASANPNEIGWQNLAAFIDEKTQYRAAHRLIIDLRQESHGYLNGNAVTLMEANNWINWGKTTEEVQTIELEWLLQLMQEKVAYNVLTPEQFREKNYDNGQAIEIKSLYNEEQLVKKWGFNYRRLAVSDHCAPMDAVVEQFIEIIDRLPENTWIHLHCRGGKGRTTTFMAMYDMLKHAKDLSFAQILNRQASVPPYYDLANTQRNNEEMEEHFQQRLSFLHSFYLYAQARLSGYPYSWSTWKQTQPLRLAKTNWIMQ